MTSQPVNVPPMPPPEQAKIPPVAPSAVRTGISKFSPVSSQSRGEGRRWGNRTRLIIGLAAGVLLLAVIGIGYTLVAKPFKRSVADLVPYKVALGPLELTVVEGGQLESAKNSDIYCRVKARNQASNFATTIKWIVDDGTAVKKDRPEDEVHSYFTWNDKESGWEEKVLHPDSGVRTVRIKEGRTGKWIYADLVAELDDSGLQDQLTTEKTTLDTALANKVTSEQQYKLNVDQSDSNIKSQELTVEVAKINLEKYMKGDYMQQIQDLDGNIQLAESNLDMQRERTAWAQRMVKKGYYTTNQAEAEEAQLKSRELQLRSLMEQKRVFLNTSYGLKKFNETQLKNAVAQAERELLRLKSAALGQEMQWRADRDTKRSIYDQELSKYKDLVSEVKKCKLWAPQDGLVVYFVSDQARFGAGAQQSIIAQGENVREGQKLMQIPDLKHMLVNTRVHEAIVARVHEGQKARIVVDSYSDHPMKGHVDSIANTSSQLDWLSSDVRYYTTKVAIDDAVDGLKPGMNAKVTIFIHDTLEHVLRVPIEAVVGGPEMGEQRIVYVITKDGPVAKTVTPGMSNDKLVEIKDGLQEGDVVALNPAAIVGDKATTRKPRQAPAESEGAGGQGGRGGPAQGSPGQPGGQRGGPAGRGPGAGSPAVAGPGGPGAGAAAGNFQMTPEMRKQMEERTVSTFKALPKDKRKAALEKIPEQWRDNVKELLRKKNVEIPD